MPKRDPAVPMSALEFCQRVRVWQHNPAGTTGVAMALEEDEQQTLEDLVREYNKRGPSAELEERAHRFLTAYRARDDDYAVLPTSERARLDAILAVRPKQAEQGYRQPQHYSPRFRWPTLSPSRLLAGALVGVVVVGSAAFGVDVLVNSRSGSPPPGVAQQHPPAQQVPIGTTNLQQLKQDYGPWQQETPSDQRPQTGQPALLLLEDGGYFASQKWTVPANASGWQQDIAGNVNNVDVKGDHADITDADSNPYIVGIDQPFIVSSNPGTVLRIDSTGNVLSMTLAQATAVRQSNK